MRKKDQMFILSFALGVVVIGLLLAVALRQKPDPAPYGFKFYKSSKDGYSLIYPNDWQRAQRTFPAQNGQRISAMFGIAKTAAQVGNLPVTESVNIVIDDLSMSPSNLEEYTERAIFQLRMVFKDALTVVSSSEVQLGGLSAHQFVYEITIPDKGTVRFMHVWAIYKKKGYQFTYAGAKDEFDFHLSKVNQMIESFKFR